MFSCVATILQFNVLVSMFTRLQIPDTGPRAEEMTAEGEAAAGVTDIPTRTWSHLS